MKKNPYQYRICPCFISHSEDTKEITCRDLFYEPEEAVNILRYRSRDKYQNQKDSYCRGGCYQMCEHYISYRHFQWKNEDE